MRIRSIKFLVFVLPVLLVWPVVIAPAQAADPVPAPGSASQAGDAGSLVRRLVSESRAEIREAIRALQKLADEKTIPALKALGARLLRATPDGRVVIVDEDEENARDVFSGAKVEIKGLTLREPRVNNSIRRAVNTAVFSIQLLARQRGLRYQAALQLSKESEPQTELEQVIRKAYSREKDPQIKRLLALALARIDFESSDTTRKIAAIKVFEEVSELSVKEKLQGLLEKDEQGHYKEKDARLRQAAQNALLSLRRIEFISTQINNLFFGLSYGSVLLLAAIGLAITFGLMGVINMAHGEMVMLGAVTTYTIQQIFQAYFPGAVDYFLLLAIPCAFIVSGLVGIGIERTVVRYLYGRPLDTLLATWGVGLVIIQAVRLTFGAQNVPVKVPEYLVGSMQVLGVVIQYNRLAIILFSIVVVTLVWYILRRTSLGLQLRAVTQNRQMAASMGVPTRRIDMWAFGLGSGVAGLGGVALSQVVNVGPAMGQSIIIVCFLVVVLGGVGNLAGTVLGALTIGVASKFIESYFGANLTDFVLLVLVIVFIRMRPQGMFPQKGRAAEE